MVASGSCPFHAQERNRTAGETRLERYLDRTVDRATSPRGAAIVIVCATVIITFLSGFLMAVLDHENDVTLGSGLWWAIQTVTTVGYGDNVPTFAGRVLAALVMLFGIGFLTVITAAITSTFVARSQVEQHESEPPRADRFDRMGERLDRIEAALGKAL